MRKLTENEKKLPQFLMAQSVIEQLKKAVPIDSELNADVLVDSLACAGLSLCISQDASYQWLASLSANPEEYLAKVGRTEWSRQEVQT